MFFITLCHKMIFPWSQKKKKLLFVHFIRRTRNCYITLSSDAPLVVVHSWKYFVSIFPTANARLSRFQDGTWAVSFLLRPSLCKALPGGGVRLKRTECPRQRTRTDVVPCSELMPMKQANTTSAFNQSYPSHFWINFFTRFYPIEHKPFLLGLCQ